MKTHTNDKKIYIFNGKFLVTNIALLFPVEREMPKCKATNILNIKK